MENFIIGKKEYKNGMSTFPLNERGILTKVKAPFSSKL